MDTVRIAELLHPFAMSALSPVQLGSISTYIDLLLKWNARMNLTAVRVPEEMVTRHFGESLFAAQLLFPCPPSGGSVVDVGSGAGFPGLPLKIWNPGIHLTLIESNQKKATFLGEVARALTLTDVNVFCGRVEQYDGERADVVTLRAVERFETVLPLAASLVGSTARIALLISEGQVSTAQDLAPGFEWGSPSSIPGSSRRVVFLGARSPVAHPSEPAM